MHLQVDSSALAEGVGTSRGAETVECALEFFRAIGAPISYPVFVGTDNKASQMLASGTGNATRLRHALRRWYTLKNRVAAKMVQVGHVADPENPSDYLTKWAPVEKFEHSVEYCTNRRNRLPAIG